MKLNDLDLNKLHVFRIVAESSSLKEAGTQLLRTPSAISQSLSSLERALGILLFKRVGIRLELTDQGQALLEQIKSNEQSLQKVLNQIQGTTKVVRGLVSLGLPMGYSSAALGQALGDSLLLYPELQLRLRFMLHAELAEALIHGRVEMALSLQPLNIWNRSIRSVELKKEHMVLAIPSNLRSLFFESEIDHLPVVDYFQKPLLIETWLKHHKLHTKKIQMSVRAYGASLDHVLEFVKKGVGCALVPRHSVQNELDQGMLFEHTLDKKSPLLVNVWLNSYHSSTKLSSQAQVFWKSLMK